MHALKPADIKYVGAIGDSLTVCIPRKSIPKSQREVLLFIGSERWECWNNFWYADSISWCFMEVKRRLEKIFDIHLESIFSIGGQDTLDSTITLPSIVLAGKKQPSLSVDSLQIFFVSTIKISTVIPSEMVLKVLPMLDSTSPYPVLFLREKLSRLALFPPKTSL